MPGLSLIALLFLVLEAAATILYAGVAESGGEFGTWSPTADPNAGLPGVFGKDYAFIDKAGVDVYVDKNRINLFRVAFLLERMCPPSTGLGPKFNETHFGHYADAINYITVTKGAYALLDPHNYMRYNNPSQQPYSGSVIGNSSDPTAATTAQFGAFWGELARRFKKNEKVIFGLMNEPHDMDTNLIFANNQAAITAIRKAGAKQLILAPGNAWAGARHWTEDWTGNSPSSASVMGKLQDPANNTAIDVHQYFEEGGSDVCSISTPVVYAPLTAWLKEHNMKAMVTEWGSPNGTQCAGYVRDMLNYVANNTEYIGWAAWAAGPFWGTNSPCCSDGNAWGSLEPGSKASDGGPSLYDTVWLGVIQPLLPKKLQRNGISSIRGKVA
ncbi:glycoside hydrolase superfamily [Paraphoma chrysanthemicola]|uniref:cellulase n=1 Tax=Paraphoma chrysanthemicola TaxID=798071 RepID=A0A8K0W3G2_9PLEO|nr:glycoside hydrolase superfamily [Paraphoma chrysanthemicola]